MSEAKGGGLYFAHKTLTADRSFLCRLVKKKMKISPHFQGPQGQGKNVKWKCPSSVVQAKPIIVKRLYHIFSIFQFKVIFSLKYFYDQFNDLLMTKTLFIDGYFGWHYPLIIPPITPSGH